MPHEILNPELKLAFDFVEQTNTNLFLTGKAGTGKTTFLCNLKTISPKRMIVVAPTGVAAINAGGVTIHSFFQMHFGPHIPEQYSKQDHSGHLHKSTFDRIQRFSREKINIIRSLDLLVIDEISMVRADLLDAIDEVLRRLRGRNSPFGGVQLLMIGDLQQLAPVAKDDEWEMLRPYYDTYFFFGSRALQKTTFTTIELKHIYRQSDENFISLLNKVRDNKIDNEALNNLNNRYIPGFNPGNDEGFITLTTHNYQAQAINESKLKQLKNQEFRFSANVEGDFPEFSYPTDYELVLKVEAQVMFVKNDISREKLFYNGKIGKIAGIEDDIIFVKCEEDNANITVELAEWTNNKYSINEETKEITETPVGRFVQFPLKLAWAITIHKSQGLTFEKAIIDANAAFTHGQVYVALSRCKTFEGMILSSPISQKCIKSDTYVKDFTLDAEQNQPGEKELMASKIAYQQTLLNELLDFSVIQHRFFQCQKLIKENSNILLPVLPETFKTLYEVISKELISVSDKFKPQIGQFLTSNPMIEGHDELQERIKKASIYFSDKLQQSICLVLQNIDIETDNKAIKKSLKESIENLYEVVFIKTACFNSCISGFNVKNYLAAKARASIEKLQLKHEPKQKFVGSSDGKVDSALLSAIKSWRAAKAKDEDLPIYMILPQRTMYDLAELLPLTRNELLRIKGFGKKKLQKYGEDIICIINNYMQAKHFDKPDKEEVTFQQEHRKERKPKQEKGQTQKLSFEMFKQGKSIDDIARERSLSRSTIEGHLSSFIETGELPILNVMSTEKVNYVSEYLNKTDFISLSAAIKDLGSDITYGEVRMVINYLNYMTSVLHSE